MREDEPGRPEAQTGSGTPAEYAAGHGELLHQEPCVAARVSRIEQLPWHCVLVGQDGELPYPVPTIPELLAEVPAGPARAQSSAPALTR